MDLDDGDPDDNSEMLNKCYNINEDREAILTSNAFCVYIGDGDVGDLDVEDSNFDDHTKDPNYSPQSSEVSDGESTLEDSFIYTKENEEDIPVTNEGIELQEGDGRRNILVLVLKDNTSHQI
ncbi:uncharacterized protein LOC120353841 [Nilaparvata lugens]|uniref:uncharacterized protein LOC120353841 n=1 Tax=Nilaparvata lugens TaxID=108931 RepID=UPI00193E113E|nr:uncharacterized protein LOC120353841 [Nilaparvata lugens]